MLILAPSTNTKCLVWRKIIMNAGIIGVGKYIPEKVVTNADLEKMMDTSDEWIRSRTGISERRVATDEIDTSDMAYEAAKEAIASAGIHVSEIDMILVATVTPDRSFPSVACQIQERLGATNAAAMDLSAACTGFIYGVITAAQFVQNKIYQHILVIGVEKLSKITNWEDRNTAVLFGDSAGAAIIGNVSDGKGILSFELGADGGGGGHLYLAPEGLVMNGREVFKFAVRQMADSCINVLEKANLTKEDIDLLIPHQANIRIIESSRERLGLPQEKVVYTIHKYGNTSAATIPVALAEYFESGKIKDNDVLLLVAFGGGLTWGAICLKWGR